MRHARIVHGAVAEPAGRDLVEGLRERGALLLDRLRVVEVLVAEVLDRGREVPEEDCFSITASAFGLASPISR